MGGYLRSGDSGYGLVCPECRGQKTLNSSRCHNCSKIEKPVIKVSVQELKEAEQDISRIVGENVRDLRLSINLSARDLASLAGVSNNVIWRIENGKSTQIPFIARIARVLGVPAWQLLEPAWRRKLHDVRQHARRSISA